MSGRTTLWDLLPRLFDRVDRYLARIFWSSYLVTFVFFFGFFMVMELLSLVDDIADVVKAQDLSQSRVLLLVAAYYLYQAPTIFLQVAPFVTVIATIVMLARMRKCNEIIPILMSGRSVFRMMRPVFLFAAFLMVSQILIQEVLSPQFSGRRLALRRYLAKGEVGVAISQPVADREGNQWMDLKYQPVSGTIRSGRVIRLDEGQLHTASIADWDYDADLGGWKRTDGQAIQVSVYRTSAASSVDSMTGTETGNRGPSRVEEVRVLTSSLSPAEVLTYAKEPFDLSFRELIGLYQRSHFNRHLVLLHYHITFPLSNLLLILLTVPFILRFDRQSVMQGITMAFLLCGAYYASDFTLQNLGDSTLHPVLAAWLAPIFFGALGISLFDGIRS